MESCSKETSEHLHSLKRVHVSELYLARRQLTDVPDLSRFTQLRYIWLNNNRIRYVRGPVFYCCVAELYLQNNRISSITGALKHLRCLRVLLLHNNHLSNMEETVGELKSMHYLQTLNLFLNPFSQNPLYREHVLHHLPSVRLLDREEVRQQERRRAFKLLSPERQTILDALAFNRRALAQSKIGGAPTLPFTQSL